MESERALKKDWKVTPEAFEKTAWLDSDCEAAAEKMPTEIECSMRSDCLFYFLSPECKKPL
jgi:hypothetical protein